MHWTEELMHRYAVNTVGEALDRLDAENRILQQQEEARKREMDARFAAWLAS